MLKKIIIGIFGTVLIFIIAIGILIHITFKDGFMSCENTLLQESYSPDKRIKIVVFDRGCGATTGFSTQVSELPGSHELNNDMSGNLHILDGYNVPVKITWQNTNQYKVTLNGSE